MDGGQLCGAGTGGQGSATEIDHLNRGARGDTPVMRREEAKQTFELIDNRRNTNQGTLKRISTDNYMS